MHGCLVCSKRFQKRDVGVPYLVWKNGFVLEFASTPGWPFPLLPSCHRRPTVPHLPLTPFCFHFQKKKKKRVLSAIFRGTYRSEWECLFQFWPFFCVKNVRTMPIVIWTLRWYCWLVHFSPFFYTHLSFHQKILLWISLNYNPLENFFCIFLIRLQALLFFLIKKSSRKIRKFSGLKNGVFEGQN